jgi:hypothetical protein
MWEGPVYKGDGKTHVSFLCFFTMLAYQRFMTNWKADLETPSRSLKLEKSQSDDSSAQRRIFADPSGGRFLFIFS